MIYSFPLSQGSPELQAYIFQYLHLKYLSWRIPEDKLYQIAKAALPIAQKYVFAVKRRPELNTSPYKLHITENPSGEELTEELVEDTLKEELLVMKVIFAEDYDKDLAIKNFLLTQSDMDIHPNIRYSLTKIIHLMKERDQLFKDQGREVEYFQKYVINKDTTRISIYDQLMTDLREELEHPSPLKILEKPK